MRPLVNSTSQFHPACLYPLFFHGVLDQKGHRAPAPIAHHLVPGQNLLVVNTLQLLQVRFVLNEIRECEKY